MNPLVSIILPTYNGSKFIRRAIESVIRQDFNNWELIIIDDGSTDDTRQIIDEFIVLNRRLRYIRNKTNLGIQKSLNRGLKEARGEYIGRIDDDDIWVDREKLNKQIAFLQKHTGHVLVGTGTIVVDEMGREILRYFLPEDNQSITERLLQKNCFVHSSVVFKKEPALNLGGYDESEETLHVEDYDLWLRLGVFGKLANLPFYGIQFSLRVGNISSRNKIDQFKKDIRLTKKYRNNYPHFLRALIFSYLRLISYRIFNLLSDKLRYKLLKIFKEF